MTAGICSDLLQHCFISLLRAKHVLFWKWHALYPPSTISAFTGDVIDIFSDFPPCFCPPSLLKMYLPTNIDEFGTSTIKKDGKSGKSMRSILPQIYEQDYFDIFSHALPGDCNI